jgi:hypothetical protein
MDFFMRSAATQGRTRGPCSGQPQHLRIGPYVDSRKTAEAEVDEGTSHLFRGAQMAVIALRISSSNWKARINRRLDPPYENQHVESTV